MFYVAPDWDENEKLLRSIVRRLGITSDLAAAFLPTTPIWFGLWAKSPLSPAMVRIVRSIVVELRSARSAWAADAWLRGMTDGMDAFVVAADHSLRSGVTMRVSLDPPGTAGFDYTWDSAHCPVCKAGIEGEVAFPSEQICKACGTPFTLVARPAMETRPDDPSLAEVLGVEGFRSFAHSHMVAGGLSTAEADAVQLWLDNRTAGFLRQAEAERATWLQRRRYLWEHVFVGLSKHFATAGNECDPPWSDPRDVYFDVHSICVVLSRCRALGVSVKVLVHRSDRDPTLRRIKVGGWFGLRIRRPERVLARWRREGCNGLFGVDLLVPDRLLVTTINYDVDATA